MAVDKFSSAAGPNTGLIKIVPTSIAVGSGSGSVDVNGNVIFSGASSVSMNNTFTSSFSHYKVVGEVFNTANSGRNITMRLRASGADNTGTNYSYAYDGKFFAGGSTPSTQYYAEFGANFLLIGYGSYYTASPTVFTMDIISPQAASETKILSPFISGTAANQFGGLVTGAYTAANQFDGFSIISTSGSVTGNIRIYGYNQ